MIHLNKPPAVGSNATASVCIVCARTVGGEIRGEGGPVITAVLDRLVDLIDHHREARLVRERYDVGLIGSGPDSEDLTLALVRVQQRIRYDRAVTNVRASATRSEAVSATGRTTHVRVVARRSRRGTGDRRRGVRNSLETVALGPLEKYIVVRPNERAR